jgi:hypothetical protein
MKLSHWEATGRSAIQEFPYILWNPKVHYRVHKIPSLVHTLSQMNPVHTTSSYLSNIHINITLLLTRLIISSGSFSSGFYTKIL